MNKVIFVGLETEQKAYEGDRALHDMHRDGTITLFNDAIVVRDKGGKVTVKEQPDAEAVGTLSGMLAGSLIGLLGGPVGLAVGFGAGTLTGAAFDLTREGVDSDFVNDVGARLDPGKAGLIAEIDEDWQLPLDTRMEGLGGKILRRTRPQIDDMYLEREIAAQEKELAALEAEKLAQVKASHEAKAKRNAEKLQAKIDAEKKKLQQKEDALSAKAKAVEQEAKEQIAALEAQKQIASADSKDLLDERLREVRRDYERRTVRLKEALNRRKAMHGVSA